MSAPVSSLPVAVRVYPRLDGHDRTRPARWPTPRPDLWLVFDMETRLDASQAFTVGSYRCYDHGVCLEEGLILADDLPAGAKAVVERYAATHPADVGPGGVPTLYVRTRAAFLDRLFEVAYRSRGLVIGFNLPFDLSRLAFDVTRARGPYAGGFSLSLWSYTDASGMERADRYRPRLALKHIDGKRTRIAFRARRQADPADRIPDGSPTGAPEPGYHFPGHFLDLRTLAFALTDQSHSLASACAAWGVAHPKQRATRHGVVTTAYLDYNRRDVLATAELATALITEYDRHPIALPATKAYSPAAIGKAYLGAMGLRPILERQPDLPAVRLGHAQAAFFGGRASTRIRQCAVPVVYTDFLSMYPTVNSLLGLWRIVTAARVRLQDVRPETVTAWLRRLTPEDLFRPETWARLRIFVRVVPDGDLLPTRSHYGAGHDWQIAMAHLYADPSVGGLWYALPDVVASWLQTGRVPHIVEAFRLTATGTAVDLQPTTLHGEISIDPRQQDFFRAVIEERARAKQRADWPADQRERTQQGLKVLANGTSYGIFAETHVQDRDTPQDVQCFGLDATPFPCRVRRPDVPGEYCFPPLASLITSGARLMLALLEHQVTARGGTYAMEDTDSMAIVATPTGGLVPCPGGADRLPDGQAAVRALSWDDVREIVARFETLNPYDRTVVPGSILKIEADNFDDAGRQRPLFCYAIAAKRYALFTLADDGTPTLVRHSEHGLGHLLNPTDPDSADRDWIAQAWTQIIRGALGLPTAPLPFADRPAIGRISVSSPAVLAPFADLNQGKGYARQVKPHNFLLGCHVRALGHPAGADPAQFHLIAPYEPTPERWTVMRWIDQYSRRPCRVTTSGHHGTRGTARVKTYGDVLSEYAWHPEAKGADAQGHPSDRRTVGFLQRRHVRLARVVYIGKESNRLDDVTAGQVHAADAVYTVYADQQRDEWQTDVVPALKRIPLKTFERLSGKSRRLLIDARTGRRRLRPKSRALLRSVARRLGLL